MRPSRGGDRVSQARGAGGGPAPAPDASGPRPRGRSTARGPHAEVSAGGKTIVRKVPRHDLTIFEGCTDGQIIEAVDSIRQAIELGAPLYNAGNHEACYRIYEGTSMRFERESGCKGVRDAFGAGLLRSSTLDSFTEKAWALRDTFDGLLEIAVRHATLRQP